MKKGAASLTDPKRTARRAGLRYISTEVAGISRRREGDRFSYWLPSGERVEDDETLKRIKGLVLPPAWEKVWISPYANSHLQATGYDAKGRKQYKYHTLWAQERNETKFSRMLLFARALPAIRQKVEKDLNRRAICKEKVVAAVIGLMEKSYIRIGNHEYARTNKSYGLTTMRDKHVEIKGSSIRFRFKGKKGVAHEIALNDRRLAGIVKKCRDIPGYELFQYFDEEGEHHPIDSGDINAYLHEVAGEEFTAKDFRTWAGTLEAFNAFLSMEPSDKKTEIKSQVVQVVKHVSRSLGNTPSICRKYYIHPSLISSFEEGRLHELATECRARAKSRSGLRPDECVVEQFLETLS